jgi:hypothetical protein
MGFKNIQILPMTVCSVLLLLLLITLMLLAFPGLCPSLCQVSLGWWTEDQVYSVSCWTLGIPLRATSVEWCLMKVIPSHLLTCQIQYKT